MKTMPASDKKTAYAPSDLEKPKVKGLALHNATLAVNRARVEKDEQDERTSSFFVIRPELTSYCLFAVLPDCGVLAVASAPTSSDFAKFTSAGNLAALSARYRAIGFIAHRDGQNPKRAQMVVLPVPLNTKKGGAK